MRRTDDERLALLVEVVARLEAEPAAHERFVVDTHYDLRANTIEQTTIEAARPLQRSYLMEVRKLDAPGEDVFLVELIEILLTRVTNAEVVVGLRAALSDYEAQQVVGPIVLSDDAGEISPRLAFELWAYGEHLHDDLAKAARMEQMHPLLRDHVRAAAHAYMTWLVDLAILVRNIIQQGLARPA